MLLLIMLAAAVMWVVVTSSTPGLPLHYMMSHYDAKNLTLQILIGLVVAAVLIGIDKIVRMGRGNETQGRRRNRRGTRSRAGVQDAGSRRDMGYRQPGNRYRPPADESRLLAPPGDRVSRRSNRPVVRRRTRP